ncbi:MAG: MFS superfamily sulfate permease-like transporter, partial [Planctomycetota bacterium]
AAAVLQIGFALLKAGKLGDFFPSAVVHGMLAAIGVIICAKQAHVLMGVKPEGSEPLHLLAEIPHSLTQANPEIFLIGLVSLLLIFGLPVLARRIPKVAQVPAPIVVLMAAVPMALFFDLAHEHSYVVAALHRSYVVGPTLLVSLPDNLLSALAFPDFSQVFSPISLKYIVMFALVGSIESLLSAKAVDMLDPQQRRSNLDSDLLSVGIGNLVSAFIGGLPMISEIVRSTANIQYGARSRLSNFFHGCFLLAAAALIPGLIHQIPLAALAAMLIFTGLRLASPKEFIHAWQIGREQFVLFSFTLMMTLATDLLIGVAAGIALKLVFHLVSGASPRALFRPTIEVREEADHLLIAVHGAAVFSNFLALSGRLAEVPRSSRVVLDLSESKVVDHTVMEKLHVLEQEFSRAGGDLDVRGLDDHTPVSKHPLAARRRSTQNSPDNSPRTQQAA